MSGPMSKGEIQNLGKRRSCAWQINQEREVDNTNKKAFTALRLPATADFERLAKGGSYRTR